MNDSFNTEIVKLHEHYELIQDVVKIINLEWPRSESARIHSLKDSRDDLPCSLLLIHKHEDGNLDVIGHSRLSKVHGNQKSVFIENVIIEKTKRGCGLGRKLMELTELYVSKLGHQDIYLSTHDKCKFYEYLGYVYCSPVSPVRANAKLLTPEQFSALQVHFGEQNEQNSKEHMESISQSIEDEKNSIPQQPVRKEACKDGGILRQNENPLKESQKSICENKPSPSLQSCAPSLPYSSPLPPAPPLLPPPPPPAALPPPPPPPSILSLEKNSYRNYESEKQFWMVKHL